MVKSLQEQITKMAKPTPPFKDINPKTGKVWCRYCHTYSCYIHFGIKYQDKAPEHKDEATFRNCMGGSNFNCLPVNN